MINFLWNKSSIYLLQYLIISTLILLKLSIDFNIFLRGLVPIICLILNFNAYIEIKVERIKHSRHEGLIDISLRKNQTVYVHIQVMI